MILADTWYADHIPTATRLEDRFPSGFVPWRDAAASLEGSP